MFPCYANKTQSLSAGTDNGLFECMQICSFLSSSNKGQDCWSLELREQGLVIKNPKL